MWWRWPSPLASRWPSKLVSPRSTYFVPTWSFLPRAIDARRLGIDHARVAHGADPQVAFTVGVGREQTGVILPGRVQRERLHALRGAEQPRGRGPAGIRDRPHAGGAGVGVERCGDRHVGGNRRVELRVAPVGRADGIGLALEGGRRQRHPFRDPEVIRPAAAVPAAEGVVDPPGGRHGVAPVHVRLPRREGRLLRGRPVSRLRHEGRRAEIDARSVGADDDRRQFARTPVPRDVLQHVDRVGRELRLQRVRQPGARIVVERQDHLVGDDRPVRQRKAPAILVGDDAQVPVRVVAGQQHPREARLDGGGVHGPAGGMHAAGFDGHRRIEVRPEVRRERARREGVAIQVVARRAGHHADVDAEAVQAGRQAGRQVRRERKRRLLRRGRAAVGERGRRRRLELVERRAELVAEPVGHRALDTSLDRQARGREQRRHLLVAWQAHPAVSVECALGGDKDAQPVGLDTRGGEAGQVAGANLDGHEDLHGVAWLPAAGRDRGLRAPRAVGGLARTREAEGLDARPVFNGGGCLPLGLLGRCG